MECGHRKWGDLLPPDKEPHLALLLALHVNLTQFTLAGEDRNPPKKTPSQLKGFLAHTN